MSKVQGKPHKTRSKVQDEPNHNMSKVQYKPHRTRSKVQDEPHHNMSKVQNELHQISVNYRNTHITQHQE